MPYPMSPCPIIIISIHSFTSFKFMEWSFGKLWNLRTYKLLKNERSGRWACQNSEHCPYIYFQFPIHYILMTSWMRWMTNISICINLHVWNCFRNRRIYGANTAQNHPPGLTHRSKYAINFMIFCIILLLLLITTIAGSCNTYKHSVSTGRNDGCVGFFCWWFMVVPCSYVSQSILYRKLLLLCWVFFRNRTCHLYT